MADQQGLEESYVGSTYRAARSNWDSIEQTRMLAALLRPSLGLARSKETAGALMLRFGSLPATLAAPAHLLQEIDGVGGRTASQLALTLRLAQGLARARISPSKPLLSSWAELMDYCTVAMAYVGVEQFRILFLDKKNRLIADEVQQVGTVDHTPVYPREVIRRSLELSASALILVHNHPSGDPTPSAADVRITRDIADIAKPMGIILHDHIVIGHGGHASLKALRLF